MYSVVPCDDVAGGVEMVQEGLDKVCRVHVDINALQGQCFLQRLRAGAHARAPGQEEVCRGKPCHPQRQVPAVGEDVLAGLAGFVKLEDVPQDLHPKFDGGQRVKEGRKGPFRLLSYLVRPCSLGLAPLLQQALDARPQPAALPFKLGEVPTEQRGPAVDHAYVIVKGLAEVGQHAEHMPVDHVHAAAAAGEPVARDVVDRAHQRLDVRAALGPPHVFVQALVVLGQRMQELGSLCTHPGPRAGTGAALVRGT